MKTYLVTGAAGFIGANYLKYISTLHKDINIIVVDVLTYAGNLGTIEEELKDSRIKFEKVDIQVDNKNPLFNTYISIDSVKNSYYKISDFNLINVTKRDTLFFRSEFKGGNKADDYYNIDAYHTIDEEKNSVVGIFKSELNFKDLDSKGRIK